jgi:serine protease Do
MKLKIKYVALVAAVPIAAALVLFFSPARGFTQVRSETSPSSSLQPPATPQLTAETGNLESLQYSFREVAKKVLPVVVEINVTQVITQKVPQMDFPFDFPFPFFDQQPKGKGGEGSFRQSGLGSGIIVQHTGDRYYVLTNNHVVKDANDISVRLSDQRVFKAKVVGTDPRKDIALVTFDSRDNLPVAELGDSDALQVGDIVIAVGNPLGFESTVTMGIVSALGRHGPPGDVAAYTDYIQTDAAINQGNSGGALVNIKGQVVGMNTWIAAPSGGNVGLGFAVPINNARSEISQFIEKGRVDYGWLGTQIADIQDSSTYPGFAADLKVEGVKGALMLNLYKGSPADKAGLLPGDYITAVDGSAVSNADELTQAVGRLEAGKTYPFAFVRYGEKMQLPVKIGVRDEKDQVAQEKNLWPGMTVIDINDQVRQELKIPVGLHGVVVGYLPDQDTPASIAGFRPGDVITDVNGKPVRDMMDYYKALNDRSTPQVTFHLVREGTDIRLGLSP